MNLTNDTPYLPFIFEAYGQRDELLNVVFCRGTFDLQADGKLSIATEQQPVVLADQYRTEPLVSSVQVDTDLVPHKFAADVTLNAIAHALHGQPATIWPVGVRVGKLYHSLRVTGPQCWKYSLLTGWQLSRPEPTLSVPIQYEYAFGGRYQKVDKEPEEVVFEQNPVGVLVHRKVESVTSGLTQCEGIVHGDFAASYGEGLSHRAKVGMEGSRPLSRAAPHSDFGLHDARVAPLQSPILREDLPSGQCID